MGKTNIPEIDAFVEAEIELIGGETNEEEKVQLFRIFYNGMRTILMAQAQLPAHEDATSSDRVKRRLNIIKQYLKESKHEGN